MAGKQLEMILSIHIQLTLRSLMVGATVVQIGSQMGHEILLRNCNEYEHHHIIQTECGPEYCLTVPDEGKQINSLTIAAISDNPEIVKLLLSRGVKLPLDIISTAYAAKNVEIVKVLVESGVEVDTREETFGMMPLYLAANANVDIVNKNSFSPIHFACQNGHKVIVKHLIDNGCEVERAGLDGYTPLHVAATAGYTEYVNLLLAKGVRFESSANIEAVDEDNSTSLIEAALCGHVAATRFLLEAGANLNAAENNGQTALQYTARNGKIEIVEVLGNFGSDLWTPINRAMGSIECIQALLDGRGSVDSRDSTNSTPLHRASYFGKFEIAQLLVGRETDINTRNNDQPASLNLAAKGGHADVMKLLVSNGAVLGYKTLLASIKGGIETVRFLIEAGMNLNAVGDSPITPLLAAVGGKIDILNLIENGADVNRICVYGITTLTEAGLFGNYECC
ncbi:E3 ubiquitin-protein ligase mib2 [Physocladia obscura]|uniref:E3 ubiquitin-protein ligase mib2 n=1 Tax=Physocladia obscura TaxID=109957 RepID=A0AAD5T774_9FUNG|nr:E3 ubiquitin-protein ligase mib2 [Physocladia obscura]